MTMVVRPGEIPDVDEPANHLTLNALVTADLHGSDVSVTRVRIDGRHRRLRTDRSTRVYTVLGGQLRVHVGDGPVDQLGSGDVVVVPRGTMYGLDGTATYLVINAPAFVDGDDVYEDARCGDDD
jgi:mannose-6-phosphate isomerase-like protein (cupin superfamily)